MKRPSRGERESATTMWKNAKFFLPWRWSLILTAIVNLPWNERYPAAGAATLTDGILGGWSYADGRWQGFQSDVDVTIDLGAVRPVHYVTATFLGNKGAWIYLPDRVTVEYSRDGEHFDLAGTVLNENPDGLYVPFGMPVGKPSPVC